MIHCKRLCYDNNFLTEAIEKGSDSAKRDNTTNHKEFDMCATHQHITCFEIASNQMKRNEEVGNFELK